MTESDRFKLLFGPYKPPRFRYGKVVSCEVRGEVVIVGMSAGRIPWPIGQRRGSPARGFVVFADLAKAVRRESNQAICHWWGVTPQTVTKWRKAMDVGPSTEGTSRLRSEYAQEEPITAAREKAWKKARDPERRKKIAAALRGKKATKKRDRGDAARKDGQASKRGSQTKNEPGSSGKRHSATEGRPAMVSRGGSAYRDFASGGSGQPYG
ncbi:MAG: hypothetical protein K8T89_16760 [Planctomycetes bacterium]|nr:hypothetical protein [Planctomycetota bacterium]